MPSNLLLLNSPYYAAYSLPLAYVAPSVGSLAAVNSVAEAQTTKEVITTTAKPQTETELVNTKNNDNSEIETLEKLRLAQTSTISDNGAASGDLKSDGKLRVAVSKINPNYVIEEIIRVPGKHIISSSTRLQRLVVVPKRQQQQRRQQQLQQQQRQQALKVEATGKTRTSGNIPQIPFGTYFLPYLSGQTNKKQAALILEPHSRAVVGNGGTAISVPISKALLKKGVPTNVYFNPESVAIAGVGGKAHAAADLELDLYA